SCRILCLRCRFKHHVFYSYQPGPPPPPVDLDVEAPLPHWRRVTGYAALGGAVAAALVTARFAVSAGQLSQQAHQSPSQVETVALNQRLADARRSVAISAAVSCG